MSYPIKEQLLTINRPKIAFTPQGFVAHSTDTPGATAQNEFNYFNSAYRGASAHYFVDWNEIIRTIPENEVAWHAGQTANDKFLSVEMCEPADDDPDRFRKFQEAWNRTVWLIADACVRYKNSDGKDWSTGPNVWSHRGISKLYGETTHTDPCGKDGNSGYLGKYGKTWDEFLAAIDAEIEKIKSEMVKVEDAPAIPKKAIAEDDIYLSVRVREQYADELIKTINGLGYACKRMDLA